MDRYYLCIDLKSFYASVECVERGLDSLTANLVVADPERSDKTICLAVSPHMKELGVKNRCRVFEIPKTIDYVMAPPRMQKYIDYAAKIYEIYLGFMAKEDIYVYSIDEVFMDITPYMPIYNKTPREMAIMLMEAVLQGTGIRATAGIGTNLYLAKIALDITAKHSPDFIGYLDEETFKNELWEHQPLTDFWRIGRGITNRLSELGIYNMKQLAHFDEDALYRKFGIDAELMIDHAWGREPVTMADIKNYKSKTKSLTSGQVLMRDYEYGEARTILREMVDKLALDLTAKGLVCSSISFQIRYSNKSGLEPAHGSAGFDKPTNSETIMAERLMPVFDEVMNKEALVRGFIVSCNNVLPDEEDMQMSFFDMEVDEVSSQDKKLQTAMLDIKEKFGKNAIFKSMDLEEAATTLERNKQIGGHKSGEE